MRRDRRTLSLMMDARYDRLLALACDIVLDQGGDWDATHDRLERELSGDDFEDAEMLALIPLVVYAEPGGGPELVRGMRDRRRRLIPAEPAGARWRRFRATG